MKVMYWMCVSPYNPTNNLGRNTSWADWVLNVSQKVLNFLHNSICIHNNDNLDHKIALFNLCGVLYSLDEGFSSCSFIKVLEMQINPRSNITVITKNRTTKLVTISKLYGVNS